MTAGFSYIDSWGGDGHRHRQRGSRRYVAIIHHTPQTRSHQPPFSFFFFFFSFNLYVHCTLGIICPPILAKRRALCAFSPWRACTLHIVRVCGPQLSRYRVAPVAGAASRACRIISSADIQSAEWWMAGQLDMLSTVHTIGRCFLGPSSVIVTVHIIPRAVPTRVLRPTRRRQLAAMYDGIYVDIGIEQSRYLPAVGGISAVGCRLAERAATMYVCMHAHRFGWWRRESTPSDPSAGADGGGRGRCREQPLPTPLVTPQPCYIDRYALSHTYLCRVHRYLV